MSFLTKIISFLALLTIVSIACIWIAGGASTKHVTRITIDAGRGQVFPYLTDGEKISKWAKGVIEVGSFDNGEDADDADREPPNKAQRRVVTEHGKQVEYEDTVMRYTFPKSFSIQSTNSNVTQTTVFQLQENEVRGTNVEYRLTRSANGIGRMFFPFEKDGFDDRMISEMRKLKEVIESEVEYDPSVEDETEVAGAESAADAEVESSQDSDGSGSSLGFSDAESSQTLEAKPAASERDDAEPKPADAERNFESLFGTGGR